MAVTNRLNGKQNAADAQLVTYESNGLEVKISPQLVRNYLVSGDKERVTIQEVAMFINLCKFNQLNPWLKEAYLIKFGNEPATLVTGKEAFQKRAEDHPAYDGCEAGIIILDNNGDIVYRKGCFWMPGEQIIGGYAEVWRKDRSHSCRTEVSFEEYAARKRDGSLNAQWSKKPGTMIRKVALVQALREAFPKTFGNMYSAEEQGKVETDFNEPIVIEAEHSEEIQPEITESSENTATAPETDARAALFGS